MQHIHSHCPLPKPLHSCDACLGVHMQLVHTCISCGLWVVLCKAGVGAISGGQERKSKQQIVGVITTGTNKQSNKPTFTHTCIHQTRVRPMHTHTRTHTRAHKVLFCLTCKADSCCLVASVTAWLTAASSWEDSRLLFCRHCRRSFGDASDPGVEVLACWDGCWGCRTEDALLASCCILASAKDLHNTIRVAVVLMRFNTDEIGHPCLHCKLTFHVRSAM